MPPLSTPCPKSRKRPFDSERLKSATRTYKPFSTATSTSPPHSPMTSDFKFKCSLGSNYSDCNAAPPQSQNSEATDPMQQDPDPFAFGCTPPTYPNRTSVLSENHWAYHNPRTFKPPNRDKRQRIISPFGFDRSLVEESSSMSGIKSTFTFGNSPKFVATRTASATNSIEISDSESILQSPASFKFSNGQTKEEAMALVDQNTLDQVDYSTTNIESYNEIAPNNHGHYESPRASFLDNAHHLNNFDGIPDFGSSVLLGTALVIGGCGFLGHHIVRMLLADSTCTSIHVMSRSPFKNCYAGVTYHIGDLTHSSHVDLIVSQVRPNVVFNTASPHAYDDHEHAYQYFTVNVDRNENLLKAMQAMGTVKAYIYTSSGSIIAVPGGGYTQATEDADTLAVPVVKKRDPYHLAKALGDKLVLDANLKIGFRTATIRPSAMYGEGDSQMIVPVIRVLEAQQTNIWMGYNDILMDVVYVGHVAEAEVLAAKGLLRGISDPSAPKVDGEAFNITDDEPHYPMDFFREYWSLAGDKTPLSKIWYVSPRVTMVLAQVAEWWTWGTTFGKKRPLQLKIERMEFVIYTRTYSIQKIRERLGFQPWVNQSHNNQDEAVKQALAWYLLPENHGPMRLSTHPAWPETPFKLITSIGYKPRPTFPEDHYCIRNAQIMAMTHNTFFRALNAIYHQAPLITTDNVNSFLSYCLLTYDFIHHHQVSEERLYFPEIENSVRIPGLMKRSVDQHSFMEAGLEKLRKYAESTSKEAYDGATLREIIDRFADVFQKHNNEEIETILDLHDKIDSACLKKLDEAMRADAEKHSDIFKVAPFVLGNQEKASLLDDEQVHFPLVPEISLVFVRTFLTGRHADLWRFNPSDMYGKPRALPTEASLKKSAASKMAVEWMDWCPVFWAIAILLALAAVVFPGVV